MQYGAVWLTREGKTTRLRRAKKTLLCDDELHLYYDESILFEPVTPALLVADEGEYSVWNKPCGMFSQGTRWGDHSSICRWTELTGFALNKLPKRQSMLVHRLDRATQGLILVAHSKKIAVKLSRLFENRLVEKYYKATVSGNFQLTTDDYQITRPIDGKKAKTLIVKANYDPVNNDSKLLIKLETGRKHQIRKHLAGEGFPIIGDRLYQPDKKEHNWHNQDLQLCSCFLSFDCPITSLRKSYQLSI